MPKKLFSKLKAIFSKLETYMVILKSEVTNVKKSFWQIKIILT